MTRPVPAVTPGRPVRRSRALVALELVTAVSAVTGGGLLAVAPQGSLLQLDPLQALFAGVGVVVVVLGMGLRRPSAGDGLFPQVSTGR